MLRERPGVCVVGPGFWAREMHLPAFATIPGVEIVCVVGRSEAAARSLAEQFGAKRWSMDYREAVKADDVDVVDILAPNYLHAPVAITQHSLPDAVQRPHQSPAFPRDGPSHRKPELAVGVSVDLREQPLGSPKYFGFRALHLRKAIFAAQV